MITCHLPLHHVWQKYDEGTFYPPPTRGVDWGNEKVVSGLGYLPGGHLPPPKFGHLPGGQLPPPIFFFFFWRTFLGFFDLQLMEDNKDGKEEVLDEVVMEHIK